MRSRTEKRDAARLGEGEDGVGVGVLDGDDARGVGGVRRAVAPQPEAAQPGGDLPAPLQHAGLAPVAPGVEVQPHGSVEPDDAGVVQRTDAEAAGVVVEGGGIGEEIVPVEGPVEPAAHGAEPGLERFGEVEERRALHPEHPLLPTAREEVDRQVRHGEPERADALDRVDRDRSTPRSRQSAPRAARSARKPERNCTQLTRDEPRTRRERPLDVLHREGRLLVGDKIDGDAPVLRARGRGRRSPGTRRPGTATRSPGCQSSPCARTFSAADVLGANSTRSVGAPRRIPSRCRARSTVGSMSA